MFTDLNAAFMNALGRVSLPPPSRWKRLRSGRNRISLRIGRGRVNTTFSHQRKITFSGGGMTKSGELIISDRSSAVSL